MSFFAFFRFAAAVCLLQMLPVQVYQIFAFAKRFENVHRRWLEDPIPVVVVTRSSGNLDGFEQKKVNIHISESTKKLHSPDKENRNNNFLNLPYFWSVNNFGTCFRNKRWGVDTPPQQSHSAQITPLFDALCGSGTNLGLPHPVMPLRYSPEINR